MVVALHVPPKIPCKGKNKSRNQEEEGSEFSHSTRVNIINNEIYTLVLPLNRF